MNQILKNSRPKGKRIYRIFLVSITVLLYILLSVRELHSKVEFRLIYCLMGLIFITITVMAFKMDDLISKIDALNHSPENETKK